MPTPVEMMAGLRPFAGRFRRGEAEEVGTSTMREAEFACDAEYTIVRMPRRAPARRASPLTLGAFARINPTVTFLAGADSDDDDEDSDDDEDPNASLLFGDDEPAGSRGVGVGPAAVAAAPTALTEPAASPAAPFGGIVFGGGDGQDDDDDDDDDEPIFARDEVDVAKAKVEEKKRMDEVERRRYNYKRFNKLLPEEQARARTLSRWRQMAAGEGDPALRDIKPEDEEAEEVADRFTLDDYERHDHLAKTQDKKFKAFLTQVSRETQLKALESYNADLEKAERAKAAMRLFNKVISPVAYPVGVAKKWFGKSFIPKTSDMKVPDSNRDPRTPPYTRSAHPDAHRGVGTGATWEFPGIEALEEMPSSQLFATGIKPHLKKEEEDRMELDLVGNGNTYRLPFWIGYMPVVSSILEPRNFSFGLYADGKAAKNVLGPKWARKDPAKVLKNNKYYKDIIENGADLQLAVMAHAARPLVVAPLRLYYGTKLRMRMNGYGLLSKQDKEAQKKFVQLFDRSKQPRLRGAKFVWHKFFGVPVPMMIKHESKVIFSFVKDPATGQGGVMVEAISPGINREREGHVLGEVYSDKLAKALFDMVIGRSPIHKRMKADSGRCILFQLNGFNLSEDPNNSDTESRIIQTLEQGRDAVRLRQYAMGDKSARDSQKALAIHESMMQAMTWQDDDLKGRARGPRGEWVPQLLAHILTRVVENAPADWKKSYGFAADSPLTTVQKNLVEKHAHQLVQQYMDTFDGYRGWLALRGYVGEGEDRETILKKAINIRREGVAATAALEAAGGGGGGRMSGATL